MGIRESPMRRTNRTRAEKPPLALPDRDAVMDPLNEDMLRRSQEYAQRYGLTLDRRLGFGKDGTVWETNRATALKVFQHADPFRREVAAYQRLAERGVLDLNGHRVPQVERVDERLLALEMTIVQPPFVLDFASAYLDQAAPEFPEDVMEEWLARKREEFGSKWAKASGVLAALRQLGIHMTDVHPGNIQFGDDG
jgi:hypothetical protein